MGSKAVPAAPCGWSGHPRRTDFVRCAGQRQIPWCSRLGAEILISCKLYVGKAWSENGPKNQRRRTIGNRRYKFARIRSPNTKASAVTHTCIKKWDVTRMDITLLVTRQKTRYKHRTTSLIAEGQDSSVGIATSYGLDGPGVEARWRRDFPHPSRPALGPTQPPIQWVPGLFRG